MNDISVNSKIVVSVSEADFEEKVVKSDRLVFVDFWANWCQPCKILSPTFEEVAVENPDVSFVKVDIDDSPGLASTYGVRSIPTLILFKEGKVAKQSTGVIPKHEITRMINNVD